MKIGPGLDVKLAAATALSFLTGYGSDGGPGGGWPDLDGLATESPTNPGLSKHYKLHYDPE